MRGSGGRDAAAHPPASLHAQRRRVRRGGAGREPHLASTAGPRSATPRSTCSCAAATKPHETVDVLKAAFKPERVVVKEHLRANSMSERTWEIEAPRRPRPPGQGSKSRLTARGSPERAPVPARRDGSLSSDVPSALARAARGVARAARGQDRAPASRHLRESDLGHRADARRRVPAHRPPTSSSITR